VEWTNLQEEQDRGIRDAGSGFYTEGGLEVEIERPSENEQEHPVAEVSSGSAVTREQREGSHLATTDEERQLAAVMEIANAISSKLDLDSILSTISSALSKVIDYDIGCVAIYEIEENCLFIRHVTRRNGDKSGEGRYVPLEESNLIGWVAINKRPVLRGNIPADKRFNEIMEEENLKSDIVVPLIARDLFIGTVNIGSYECDHFTQLDLDLVTRFSKLTSIAIENSQLLKGLENLGERYRLLMKNATDIIILLKTSGEILECNEATYKLFGYSPEEVIGKEYFLFTTPDCRDDAKQEFSRILRGEIDQVKDFPYLKKNGEIVYIEINASVIKVKEHPYLLAIAHDITERKILEERITIQNRELRAINKKLNELDQLKNDFLGRVSHELRTPLSVIMAYTGTLLEDDSQAINENTRLDFLRIIESQSKRLLFLINDLLDLSKVEITDTMLNLSAGSINEIIGIASQIVQSYAHQKDITLKVTVDPVIPIISFDPLRIRQVCINLLSNAVKFSKEGSTVTVSSRQTDTEVIVSVRDQGPGIDTEDLDSVFENFTQLDGGPTRKVNGMGIGLRLVKHYIELHRGKVWVESKVGKGCTFSFSIPKSAGADFESVDMDETVN